MNNPLNIVERFDEITAPWLTSALRKGGLLGNVTVDSVDITEIGLSSGFVSELARLTPHYGEGGEGAPTTLIAKLPSLDPATEALATSLHLYERESRFYQEIGPEAGMRTLTCYYSAMDLAQTRHVMLLQDPGPVGLHGTSPECTVDEARRALVALAGMHAKWWESDRLKETSWLGSGDSNSLVVAYPRKFRAGWDAVKERFAGRLPEGIEDVGDRYGRSLAEMMRRNSTSPLTLVHGDFRPENLYFDSDGDDVTAVTWQLVGRWHGAIDVAQLIPYALSTEERRANEERLLHTYLDALLDKGVHNYSYDQLVEHYRLGLLRSLAIFVIGDENLDLEVSEGEIWNTRRVSSLQAIIDWNCVDLLPEVE
ncbi:MAG: DUF1679 domain-containing protein [Chloroflexi bacterium]|nr:DUF1679 domain-containing protein [Chloroflexota bacterium]